MHVRVHNLSQQILLCYKIYSVLQDMFEINLYTPVYSYMFSLSLHKYIVCIV